MQRATEDSMKSCLTAHVMTTLDNQLLRSNCQEPGLWSLKWAVAQADYTFTKQDMHTTSNHRIKWDSQSKFTLENGID